MALSFRANSIGALLGRLHWLCAALFIGMTIVAGTALHSTSEASFKLFTLRQKQVAAAEEVADRLAESRLADSIVLLSSNAGTLTAAKPARDPVGEEIALLATLTTGEPISAKVRELQARWAVYGIERARLMAMAGRGDKEDAYRHFSTNLALLYHDMMPMPASPLLDTNG